MSHEPRAAWILAGGCSLAFLAAAVNVCFLMTVGTSVSHLTGDLSRVAEDVARPTHGTGGAVAMLSVALACFVMGAALSGVVIHSRRLDLQRPYGRSVTAIGALLLGSGASMAAAPLVATGLAAGACGFQNALATQHRGVVLRTTHVTGLLTDLGVALGLRLRGRDQDPWLWMAPAALVVAYFGGAAAGAGLTLVLDRSAVGVLGGLYVLGGLGWSVLKRAPLAAEWATGTESEGA